MPCLGVRMTEQEEGGKVDANGDLQRRLQAGDGRGAPRRAEAGEPDLSRRGIDVTTLRRWRLAYEERGEAAWTTPKPEDLSAEVKIAQLERIIGQLTVENAVL